MTSQLTPSLLPFYPRRWLQALVLSGLFLGGTFDNIHCEAQAASHPPASVPSETGTHATTTVIVPTDDKTVQMETFTVKSSRERGSTTEGPQPVETYTTAQISDSGAFSTEDFLNDLPPGEDGEEVLILVDGQPPSIDPATIPLDMIERIQVSLAGSIPELGAYAQGKIINIILKNNYRGGEIGERIRGAFNGGGFQQNTKFSINLTRRKWSFFAAGNHAKTDQLLACDRPFSNNQDHTARGGRDLRVAWGTPAVVQSVSGNLNGILDSAGNPVATALVRQNQDVASLIPSQFIPGNPALSPTAYAQRRFDTSAYRLLSVPSIKYNLNSSVTYKQSDRFKISLSGNCTTTKTENIGPPPTSAASSATLVPAALNPFGQDVKVGLVHTEFGPTHQDTRNTNAQIGLRLNGKIGDITIVPDEASKAWNWRASASYQHNQTRTDATDLDRDKFSAALAAAAPELRFNPFADPAAGPVNAHLYPNLTIYRARNDTSRNTRLDISTNGPLAMLPGGPLRFSFSGNYSNRLYEREDTHPVSGTPPRTRQIIDSETGAASLTIPFFGKNNSLPLLRRLETQASIRENILSDESSNRNYSTGIVWSPARPLLLRARYSVYENTPSTTNIPGAQSLVSETYIDPARADEVNTDANVFTRPTISAITSKNETQSYGFTLEPPFAKGLRLTATHNIRQHHHIYQRSFNAQDIINNEAAFAGRVIRNALTPDDIALGLPGRITAIDTTPGNSGEAQSRDINISLEYRIPSEQCGRIRLRAYATRVLESNYQITPGVEYTYRGNSGNNPPDWTFQGQASWNFKGWNTVLRINYIGLRVNPYIDGSGNSPYTTINFDLSYQFKNGIIGNFGKNLKIGVGIMNCFDASPLYADTLSGYNTGTPLGRVYTCSFTLPM